MKYVILLLAILFVTVSCDTKDEVSPEMLEGTYTGQFIRLSSGTDSKPANVTLTLENGQFTGSSDQMYYPAICRGTYSLAGQQIEFVNECFFTANFDWSLILGGKYYVAVEGENTVLTRTYPDGSTDRYTLKKTN